MIPAAWLGADGLRLNPAFRSRSPHYAQRSLALYQLPECTLRLRADNQNLFAAFDAYERNAARYLWLRSTEKLVWRPAALRHVASAGEADALVDAAIAS